MLSEYHNDWATLILPGKQQELLEAVCATGKPVILILQAGRPYDILKASEMCKAILVNWLPGQNQSGPVIILTACLANIIGGFAGRTIPQYHYYNIGLRSGFYCFGNIRLIRICKVTTLLIKNFRLLTNSLFNARQYGLQLSG